MGIGGVTETRAQRNVRLAKRGGSLYSNIRRRVSSGGRSSGERVISSRNIYDKQGNLLKRITTYNTGRVQVENLQKKETKQFTTETGVAQARDVAIKSEGIKAQERRTPVLQQAGLNRHQQRMARTTGSTFRGTLADYLALTGSGSGVSSLERSGALLTIDPKKTAGENLIRIRKKVEPLKADESIVIRSDIPLSKKQDPFTTTTTTQTTATTPSLTGTTTDRVGETDLAKGFRKKQEKTERFESRVKTIMEREERLSNFVTMGGRLSPEEGVSPWRPKEIGKLLLRKPLEIASAPVFIGGRVALATDAFFQSDDTRKILGSSFKEVPREMGKAFDPRKPEGLLNIGLVGVGAGSLGRGLSIKAIKTPTTQSSLRTYGGIYNKVTRSTAKGYKIQPSYGLGKPITKVQLGKAKVTLRGEAPLFDSKIVTVGRGKVVVNRVSTRFPIKTITTSKSIGGRGSTVTRVVGSRAYQTTAKTFLGKRYVAKTTVNLKTGKGISKVFQVKKGGKYKLVSKGRTKLKGQEEFKLTEGKRIKIVDKKASVNIDDYRKMVSKTYITQKPVSTVKGTKVKGAIVTTAKETITTKTTKPAYTRLITKKGDFTTFRPKRYNYVEYPAKQPGTKIVRTRGEIRIKTGGTSRTVQNIQLTSKGYIFIDKAKTTKIPTRKLISLGKKGTAYYRGGSRTTFSKSQPKTQAIGRTILKPLKSPRSVTQAITKTRVTPTKSLIANIRTSTFMRPLVLPVTTGRTRADSRSINVPIIRQRPRNELITVPRLNIDTKVSPVTVPVTTQNVKIVPVTIPNLVTVPTQISVPKTPPPPPVITPTIKPPVTIFPPIPPLLLGGGGAGSYYRKKKLRFKELYNPSLLGITRKVRGKRPGLLTGLEIRPIT